MIGQSATFEIPPPASVREGPQVAPGRAGEPLAWPCPRCGAVSAHCLTCPDPGFQPVPVRSCGGPAHPDWPRPPRH